MGIDSSAYNLFILNPKKGGEARTYGYRAGFSAQEKEYLATHPGQVSSIGGSPGSATHTERE